MAAVMTRFLPNTSATAPVNGAVSADGERDCGHDGADLGRAHAEFARQRGQQRLRRIEIEEGAEAGSSDGDLAGIKAHEMQCRT
jgi:hypothetical protein